MSTHIFHAERDADRSGSEISTTDSFIQEFQEFEAQVYSGALFEQKCGTSTPNENINSLPRQANNIPTMRLEPCSRETSANQHLGKHDANKLVKPPDSSHSQSTISKNSEVKKSSTSTIPSRQNLPSRLEFPALKSAANTTTTTDRHHLSSSDFIKAKFSGSNLYFVPNLLSTSDIVGSNQNFYLTTPISDPHLSVQSNSSSNQMNNTRSCNENGVEVEVKSLASLSPSNNNLNLSHQINKINLDSVASYALEDPIQTHDQVVAKMAAEGVVWIPSNASHSTTNTTAAEKTNVRQPMLQKTDQLRWYSEEIEEEKVNKCSVVRRNSVSESYHSMKQNSSTVHNDPTRDNDVNQSHSETAQSPNVPCHSVSNSSNSNFTNSQIGISESSLKQVELEAKLEEAMTIRKQQDDYIKQLQMYYDNLLTKHALAEVTIDQLRMGIRVGIDASKASDTPAHHHTSNKPRSHSMQTIHYNISNRHVSDDSYSQTDGGYHETRNDSSGNNVHYLSTPLLEQQRNRLRRNASTHDARILSTTTDSWETELGSISNSGQIGRRNDTPDMNNYNDKQSVCYSPDRRTIESGNACISGQNHFRKTSEPSRSPSNDLCSRFHDDSMKTPINWRRNTIVNSCYAGHQEQQQQQQQQTQIDLPSSLSRIYKSSVPESHNGCNENEVIINEEELENRVTNVSHHHSHHSNNHGKQPNCSKDSKDVIEHLQKTVSTVTAPSVNVTSNLNNDMVCGPEAVQMELLLRVADLQTRLSTMELYSTENRFIPESDLVTMQLDYKRLKNYYDLAKIRWTQDSQFDANKVLIDEFNDMGSQLDKLESYILNNSERISSPSCSNASSPGALRTPPPPASMSISDLPVNWKDLNMLKQSGQTASGEHNNKPVKNTEDNGVLSSPSSLPSRVDHGRLSSVSPLHSPIVEDSLSELESVYFELMQHYNKIKQLPMTTLRAEQLYNLMKRLYDLALTADNRSSIIASPNELERIFQLDGDTRKLSENLERAIALQEQLCYYQSFHGCESNASSHKEVVPQTNETNDSKVDLLKDNCTNKLSSSVSLSSYSRGHDVQNNKKNSTNSQSFTSSDTSSNQDSGLSTPPESSDGGMMRHDEPDRRHHHHQHYFPPSHQTLKHETLSTNSNSQTDNSSNTPKHSNSDSGLVMHPQTIHSSIQSMNHEHSKSPSNTSSVELKHSVCGNDKQDGMKVVKKKSPVSYSSTQSSSSITKQRIDDIENSVRLLKKNLEDLCLKGENGTPNGYVENGIPVMNRKSCQFVSPTFDSRSNLPSSGVNNLDVFGFPHLATSSPILNSNNKSGGVYVSSGQANTSSLSMQDVCEQNLVENSNCTRTILPPGRMYHRTLDRRLIMHGQENDSNYSLCSVKPQLKNNQEYVQSKSNQSITRTLFNNNNTNNNNNSRKILHRVNDSRDLNCCRKVNSSQCNNDTIRCSSMFLIIDNFFT
ncbi:unnamed protein product [Schistosoma turkestanicum]|nr:unnamed protein product [Schistosoma turkestanicum]